MVDTTKYLILTTLSNDEEYIQQRMLNYGLSVKQINNIFAPIIDRRAEEHRLRQMMREGACFDPDCEYSDSIF